MANTSKENITNASKAHVSEAAQDLLKDSKKLANELYEESRHRMNGAQQHAKEYSDEILEKVRKNPATSVLVAAGVGFLLSAILRK